MTTSTKTRESIINKEDVAKVSGLSVELLRELADALHFSKVPLKAALRDLVENGVREDLRNIAGIAQCADCSIWHDVAELSCKHGTTDVCYKCRVEGSCEECYNEHREEDN